MNNNEIQLLKNNINNQINKQPVAPMILSGSPGTGKSSAVRQLASELNMNLVEYSLPTCSIEKLSGLPSEYATPQFNKYTAIPTTSDTLSTIWSVPEIVADCYHAAETSDTILLLDDFHAMAPHLQSYFYELLLERRMGNYLLPDNVAIVGTMNDSEAAGMNGISSPIRNRLAILPITFDFDHWFTQNGGNRLHYMVASFLKAKPNYTIEEETTTIIGFASARVWTAISAELQSLDADFIQANAARIAGMQVSSEAAQAFQAHVNYIQAINFTNLVKQRTIVDLSKKDPLDAIIYSYIANFIHTVDDGLYLIDLLSNNIDQKSFIGFSLGELHLKFTASKKMSDGLTLVIDKLLDQPMDESKYTKTSVNKLTKAFSEPMPYTTRMMELASVYLL